MCLKFERQTDRFDGISYIEEGTTKWIWTHPSYKAWTKEESAILWIQGKPGSGKSVLAKAILETKEFNNSHMSAEESKNNPKTHLCS